MTYGRGVAMTESTPLLAPAGPDLVAALRAVAPSDGLARAAACTWATAQSLGWEGARRLRRERTWYRHLELLERAGFAVPLRRWKDRRVDAAHESSRATTLADLYARVGQRFMLTAALPDEAEFYPAGSTGLVFQLQLRNNRWCFVLDFDGVPGGCEEVAIGWALHHCEFSQEGTPDAA